MKKLFFKSQQSAKKNEPLKQLKNFFMPLMKTFLLLLLIAAYGAPAFSQWTLLNSGVTNTLRAPYFISENTGIVVGEPIAPAEAIILKTTDGGVTWVSKTSGTLNALRGVHFIDANTGFAVGFTGTILKTTNAGETWAPVTSGTTQALRSVYFPSHDIGYIAGGAGTMLKTTNAGVTWTPQTTNVTQDLINVRFYNNDIGYAVSGTSTFTSGIVIKTTNGGATWTSVYTNDQGLLGLAVADENTVYAGGGNNQGVGGASYIVKSSDAGSTWQVVYTGISNGSLRGAWFVSADKGWFVGDLGEMPFTNNGGNTWTNDSAQFNGLLGIQFPVATVGYAVGAGGVILKYNASACDAPTGLNVSNITSSAAEVQWAPVSNALGYKIFYHPVGSSSGTKKPSSTNSKVLKNLLPNTKYKWAVQSVCPNNLLVATPGPNFTTLPLRLSGETTSSLNMGIFPNPASETATISFSINDPSSVTIRLIDLNGRVVREIENGTYAEGNYQVSFNSKLIPAGTYMLQLTTNEEIAIKKLMIER